MRTSFHKLRLIVNLVACASLAIVLLVVASSNFGCVRSELHSSVDSDRSAKNKGDQPTAGSPVREAHQPSLGIRVDGLQPFSLSDLERSRGACVFFVGTDCPISNAYAPEIGRIVTEFEKHGIIFYFVYAIRDLAPHDAAEHAKSFGLRGQVILDNELLMAKTLGATRMPEVLLLPPSGEAIYQGRIDDRYSAPGAKRREHPRTQDLRDALLAFVTGQSIVNARTEAVGCYLDLPK